MNNKAIIKDLKNIKQILLKYKWIKGVLATKANGRTPCDPLDPEAKCFCILGAARKAGAHDVTKTYMREQVRLKNSGYYVAVFNDGYTTKKKDVIKFLDDCITSLK